MKVSKIGKKLMSTILLAVLVLTSFTVDEILAAEKTVAGKTNYTVVTDEMYGMLVTKEPVDLTVGSKYFLTYTVESVEKNTLLGLGLLVTKDYTASGVYGDNGEGFMKYTDFNQKLNELLLPGYTYFISYEVKEDGFHYRLARAKGDESEYVNIGDVGEGVIGKEITDGKYFGLMFNGAEEYQGEKRCLSATLTRVRCYDAKGNDIALTTKGTGAATVYQPSKFTEKTVPHYYEFSLTDAKNVCISNKKQATTDTIYMSFDVVNVKRNERLTHTPFVMPNSYSYDLEKGFDGESMNDWFTGSGCVLVKILMWYIFGIKADLNGITISPAKVLPMSSMKLRLRVKGGEIALAYKKADCGTRTFEVNGKAVTPVYNERKDLYEIRLKNADIAGKNLEVKVCD